MNVENAASIEERLTWGWMGRLWNVMGGLGALIIEMSIVTTHRTSM